MRIRRGSSLIEIMIVVVIIGILTAYGAHSYMKQLERVAVQKAIENLKVIYNMEKRYFLENQQYFPVSTAAISNPLSPNRAAINAGLGLVIKDASLTQAVPNEGFTYSIQGRSAGIGVNRRTVGYQVTAQRVGGRCIGRTVRISEGTNVVLAAGELRGEPFYVSACALW